MAISFDAMVYEGRSPAKVTLADLGKHSSLKTYTSALRMSKIANAETTRNLAIKHLSVWRGVMSTHQLIDHSLAMIKAGRTRFFLYTDQQRYFFSTDDRFGKGLFAGNWTVTSFPVVSLWKDGDHPSAKIQFGVYQAIDMIEAMGTQPDQIDTYQELIDHLNARTRFYYIPELSRDQKEFCIEYLESEEVRDMAKRLL